MASLAPLVSRMTIETSGRDTPAAFATSPNAKTILFPVEATQLIGTVGGIGELVKDALASSDRGPPR